MFHLPKSLSHIGCHPFQMMSNINKYTISIQDIRNIFKRGPLEMNQLKRFNFKSQIQNEIGSSYLSHLSVGLIQVVYI
jgi:hypothetical protein